MSRFAFLLAAGLFSVNALSQQKLDTAIFSLGCFWCGEEAFEKVPGVASVISGYTDGKTKNPTYDEVSSGRTGHAESVEVKFDPSKVTYEKLKKFPQPIVTPIKPATQFWPAEDYHQDFYKKNPTHYKLYSTGCGRYARLDELWGKLRQH